MHFKIYHETPSGLYLLLGSNGLLVRPGFLLVVTEGFCILQHTPSSVELPVVISVSYLLCLASKILSPHIRFRTVLLISSNSS
jgi:hypothetical protein